MHLSKKIERYTYIHLVVSLYSFLILVCWGIPFCPMSFVGNLIFGPILTLFLGISTLLFFTEICLIPNSYLVQLLELVSNAWLWILHSVPLQRLHIPCAQPSHIVMATLFLAGVIIVIMRTSYIKKSLYICLMLISSFILTDKQTVRHKIENLPCAHGALHIIKTSGQLIIVDPGCLGRYISAPSFVQYNLMPHLVNKYGTNTIDHLILLQPGKLTFDATQAIMQKGFIKHVYIPYWHGALSKSGLCAYMRMKELAELHETKVHRLGNHEITLLKNNITDLAIYPTQQEIKKSTITFQAFCVGNIIDKQHVTFYPAKYKHMEQKKIKNDDAK